MSEFQYYEFAAIDRPLSEEEMDRLRAVSSRGEISRSGFVNHYNYGDLHADPIDWMRRYFDAFVYVANWCSCRLALRVPRHVFEESELLAYSRRIDAADTLTVEKDDEHWIFEWSLYESQDYERFGAEDGSGWMRRLAPLRDELLRGDLRPLYLGWLAGAGVGSAMDDDVPEPDVPPGLARLTSAQQALVEFIEVDADLLAAAAAGSAAPAAAESTDDDEARRVDAWLAGLSRDDMAALLRPIAQGRAHEGERGVRAAYAAWTRQQRRPAAGPPAGRRGVGELRKLAVTASVERLEVELQAKARQQAERRRRREAELREVMTQAERRWRAIEEQAQSRAASGYEQAVQGLVELAEAYALAGRRDEFDTLLLRFSERYASRPALMRRLAEAGLR